MTTEAQIETRLIEQIERLLHALEDVHHAMELQAARQQSYYQAVADATVKALADAGWLKTPAERARHDA